MNTRLQYPALPLSALSIFSSLGYADEINTAFMQGMTEVPSILRDEVRYPAGQYYVDVMLNGSRTGRLALSVGTDDEKNNHLCLTPEWLKSASIFFLPEAYAKTFDKVRGCYVLSRKENTHVDFDLGAQTLDFGIPQAWLLEKNDAAHWDYGINGLRIIYSGNFNKNIQSVNTDYSTNESLNAFGSLKTSLNLWRWILSGNINATRNNWGTQVNSSDLTLSTAISQIKGDLMLGRSQTRTELFSDFSFYGAAIRSNSNMRAWQTRGYAPLITGVAVNTSRITVSQGGHTIYSRVVPPGPWRLDDITSISNGNLIVTVENNSGQKTVTEYPVATLPSLLRSGDYNYNVAVGQRNDSNRIEDAFSSGNGAFALTSFDWGLPSVTVNMATLVHGSYQAAGLGFTKPLGEWGALSANLNSSRAKYDDGSERQGVSTTLKYAKSFSNNTDIQLLTYRYQSPGYTEFANWEPREQYRRKIYLTDNQDSAYRYVYFDGREKARYEARVNQRVDNVWLSGSFWQQTYWNRDRDAFGTGLSASTTVLDGISLFINANWSRNAWSTQDDYSASLGVSIPFSFRGIRHYASNTMGYNRYNGASFNTSASATVNNRLNYSVSAGTDGKHNNTASASASYAFERMQTNLSVSQNRSTTTLSGNLSGSAITTAENGLLLTKESTETVAVLKIKDTPGVTFGGASLPTNSNGSTVMFLSAYSPTTISINPENVPDSAELLNTSYNVVPTERAIIYREFDYQKVQRYILRVRDAQGNIMTGGSATTEQGVDAGFITNNGVLLMNLLSAPKTISVGRTDGKTCRFDATGLKGGEITVQETRCE
ncbi:PefC/AfrB family outer membrane usher protein [Serratia fonticola]|uniref:PefC/AfrB family outer membrane usher protein n=1 Tax=Serratia fonticola TaxID=47917 RepID=UPI003BB56FFE